MKTAGSYESNTHPPFLLLFSPNQPNLRAHNQPASLKLSHCTIQKGGHSLPFPRGDRKRRKTPVGLSEGTGCYSHTNSNIDEMSVPFSSLLFQVDPALSWSNFPSSFQSFHGLFHWLGHSTPPPRAKPGFTYVKTASIKIVGFFSELLSLFWSQQRENTYEIAKWLPLSMCSA